ncbi:hypothetical protein HMPREF9163_01274 [Selenomonas sp. oral taxon 138 str. F0429]|nr:hypothetical protein HMPREF9163_01274 [Selenomonas sp. oral taxon 138 str. F0429]
MQSLVTRREGFYGQQQEEHLVARYSERIYGVCLALAARGRTHGALGLWGIALPMLIVFSTNGIIAACSNAAALSCVPDEVTGSAEALIGALQYGSGTISSVLLAIFSDRTPAECASSSPHSSCARRQWHISRRQMAHLSGG